LNLDTEALYKASDLITQGKLEIGDGYRAKNNELGKVGIPFARAGNINNGFSFEDADRYPVENLDRVMNKISAAGDVVFTSKGTVGRFALVQKNTPQFLYSPQLCFWRSLDQETIDSSFLFYWMHAREFQLQFRSVATQTDMADYVNLRDQRQMQITLPDIVTQRRIAHILGTLDDKIELNRRMNETLEAMARAIFKSWFVDFDPVRAKAEGRDTGLPDEIADLFSDSFEDSELGDIPKGWGVTGLDGIADFLNGLAMQKYPPDGGESLPVIKIAQLRVGNTSGSDLANATLSPEYIIHDGDVLFSWSGSLEVVIWSGGKGALNQHLFKVTSKEYPKWFYCFWLKEHLEEFRATAAGKATTMGHIQRHHLTDAKVIVPSASLIEAATKTIRPLVDKLLVHELESRTLSQLRDLLLPRLLKDGSNSAA
jgi:type I restriction enzyme S subunit